MTKTRLFNVAVCNNFHYTHKYRITLLLILIIILCLVKYSKIVDTISLVTMTHTIYFIPMFILNNIEWY